MTAPRLHVDAVSPLLAASLVHGVTTNPTVLERAGRTVADIPEVYARWAREGAPVLLTAVFTPAQGLAAASCGIRYIAA